MSSDRYAKSGVKVETETISSGLLTKLKKTSLKKGVVSFEKTKQIIAGSESSGEFKSFDWIEFDQLDYEYGLNLAFDVLRESRIYVFSGERESINPFVELELIEAIGKNGRESVDLIKDHISEEGGNINLVNVCLIANWAEYFSHRFGELWIAAMAQHAYFIQKDNYKFGYLVALLIQKRENESNFLRGEIGLISASAGGKARAKQVAPTTKAVLKFMEEKIANGSSVQAAARWAHQKGLGASPIANVQHWKRRPKK
jgi:hypothetical protein